MEMVRQHQLGFDLMTVSCLTSLVNYKRSPGKELVIHGDVDQPTPDVSFRARCFLNVFGPQHLQLPSMVRGPLV